MVGWFSSLGREVEDCPTTLRCGVPCMDAPHDCPVAKATGWEVAKSPSETT